MATIQRAVSLLREGTFLLPCVPPGRYRLRATLAAYRRAEVDAVVSGEGADLALALEPLLVRVDEAVTVTARGEEQRAFDVPESVSTMEGDELSREALRSTPEDLQSVTGVLVLGHKARMGPVAGAVALHATRLGELIERVESTYQGSPTLDGDPVYRQRNVGEALLRGVEVEVEVALPLPSVLAAAVVYVHGQNLDLDEPMRRIPPLHGRVALRPWCREPVRRGVPSATAAHDKNHQLIGRNRQLMRRADNSPRKPRSVPS